MKKLLTWGAVLLGVFFIGCAVVYFITPAGSLPSLMPGFEAESATIHYKHAIGSLIVGLALFAFAWFKGAPAKTV
jgi:hypothetical protein